MTCSALRRSYRDLLRAGYPSVFFVHLTASRAVLSDRIAHRPGHYMPTSLLASQLATLEPLAADAQGGRRGHRRPSGRGSGAGDHTAARTIRYVAGD